MTDSLDHAGFIDFPLIFSRSGPRDTYAICDVSVLFAIEAQIFG